MKRLVLVGGGHAHVSVLQAMAHSKPQDVELTLITPSIHQNYSGMLPGWISGHYALAQCRIDLLSLAKAAGAKLILTSVVGVDANRRQIALQDGRQWNYDLVSLDIGSEADTSSLQMLGDKLLPIRPLDDFYLKWPTVLSEAKQHGNFKLIVVGAGAAGIEVLLAARQAFAKAAYNLPMAPTFQRTVSLPRPEHVLRPGCKHLH